MEGSSATPSSNDRYWFLNSDRLIVLIQKANLKEEAERSDKVAPTWNSAMRQFAKRG